MLGRYFFIFVINNSELRFGEVMMFLMMIIMHYIIKSGLKGIRLMKYGNTICLNAKEMRKLRLYMSNCRLLSFSLVCSCYVRYFSIILLNFIRTFSRRLLHLMQYQQKIFLHLIEFAISQRYV